MTLTHRKIAPALVGAALAVLGGCAGEAIPVAPAPLNVPYSTTDLVTGTGTEATTGKQLTVNYTGWLYDEAAADHKGKQFDTSVGRTPFTFTIGIGQVIKGWDQGVPGMKVGGVRRLILPPDLAYGTGGVPGTIPGNATIIFEVELLDVQG
ncbi:MAG: hypothetical protein A3H96_09650 [Acidobacteria bacterium RIFCSPLOWO2_02_FULL_67_36]|nr:MAG: hypothetical protein A3H96_09650 [Acidobacteria bacterium RIFCSPLOWO2_02_FULL_67_36]OFW24965.1 MAG: hypothetical protein A3G21_16090 [Acidobacteria bacterium RIFCSPLOWO2_12_FULL_66_21]